MPTLHGFFSLLNLQLGQCERHASMGYCSVGCCDHIVLSHGWWTCLDLRNNNFASQKQLVTCTVKQYEPTGNENKLLRQELPRGITLSSHSLNTMTSLHVAFFHCWMLLTSTSSENSICRRLGCMLLWMHGLPILTLTLDFQILGSKMEVETKNQILTYPIIHTIEIHGWHFTKCLRRVLQCTGITPRTVFATKHFALPAHTQLVCALNIYFVSDSVNNRTVTGKIEWWIQKRVYVYFKSAMTFGLHGLGWFAAPVLLQNAAAVLGE